MTTAIMRILVLSILIPLTHASAIGQIYGQSECNCLNNQSNKYDGQFVDYIVIYDQPGQDWEVLEVEHLYDHLSPNPPNRPIALRPGTFIHEMWYGTYILPVRRLNNLQWSIVITNGRITKTLESYHMCSYPIIEILPDNIFCAGQEITLKLDGDRFPFSDISWQVGSVNIDSMYNKSTYTYTLPLDTVSDQTIRVSAMGKPNDFVVGTKCRVFDDITLDIIDGGDCLQPLPVSYLSLQAIPQKNHILIQWKTQELYNSGWTIQYSYDRDQWQNLDFIPGIGIGIHSYRYIDDFVHNNDIVYYRLIQEDFDGKQSISKVISASLDGRKLGIINSLVTDGQLYLTGIAGNEIIHLYSILGERIASFPGSYQLNLNTSPGFYIVEIQGLNHQVTQKIKVQ
jgi:hypothetical protein